MGFYMPGLLFKKMLLVAIEFGALIYLIREIEAQASTTRLLISFSTLLFIGVIAVLQAGYGFYGLMILGAIAVLVYAAIYRHTASNSMPA